MASSPRKPPVAPTPKAAAPVETPAAIVPVPLAAPFVEAVEQLAADPVKAIETLSAPALEIQDSVRQAAEKGVAETRVVFERLRAVTEETQTAIEASLKSAAEGVQLINTKVVDAFRSNSDANFDFVKALFAVKSVSEAIALNSEHARKSFDTLSAQSKDLSETAQKVASDAFSPLRDSLNKVFAQAA